MNLASLSRSSVRRSRRFRQLSGLAVLVSLTLGCTISPVVSAPDTPTGRYGECRRAARDYCKRVIGATGAGQDECAADRTFQCVSGLR
jgi:hypothetical protein